MKCPNCGVVMPDRERFCEFCGTDLYPERTYQGDNPYQMHKRRQAQEGKERRQAPRKKEEERRPSAQGRRRVPEAPVTRRSKTKMLPPRSIGGAVRAAVKPKVRYRVPDAARAPLVILCGLVSLLIVVVYLWKYTVGYTSPHQLVLDFDGAVRAGQHRRAKALSSGTMPDELMDIISGANLVETYPRHLLRLDKSTRRIEYDEFIIDIERSVGKWTLTVRRTPRRRETREM